MPTNRRIRSRVAPADPAKFKEAIEAFRRRDPITDDELDVLTEVERERAFWVAGVADADIVQQVYDEIDRAIADGTTLEEFKAACSDSLTEAWGFEDAPRVETIFSTNVQTANNAGRHQMMSDPVVLQARPYWRCDRMHGGSGKGHKKETCVCAKMDGVIRPADDPLWDKNHPIFHHRCGCQLTPLSKADALAEGGISRVPDLGEGPADGFGRKPSGPGEDAWAPDIAAYAPEIGKALKKRLAG